MKHDQAPGFQNCRIGSHQESKMAPRLLKLAKTIKLTSSAEPVGIIGYKFVWKINGALVFKIVKNKKIHSRIKSQ